MTKKHTPNSRKAKRSPFAIATTLLIILFAINCLICFFKIQDDMNGSYTYEYSDMQRTTAGMDYPELTRQLIFNEVKGDDTYEDTSQFLLVSEYFRAAQLYKAYTDTGNAAEAEKLMGTLSDIESKVTSTDAADAIADLRNRYSVPDMK